MKAAIARFRVRFDAFELLDIVSFPAPFVHWLNRQRCTSAPSPYVPFTLYTPYASLGGSGSYVRGSMRIRMFLFCGPKEHVPKNLLVR